jgi:hypothetical protein
MTHSGSSTSAARRSGHIRVLDLSRVLAGPWCSQNLADLGADVIKIERPGSGDDTRAWGPPYAKDADGNNTSEAAYYLSANRGKRSVTVDIASPEGQALMRELARHSDVVLENFKVGHLKRYGLDYETLKAIKPDLVYCSITGFGQDGPYAHRAGYDFLIQGMGGLMSVTGERDELPGGGPQKAGVALTDLMTGMYATIAVLAALTHRDRTRRGPVHRHGAARHAGGDAGQCRQQLPHQRQAAQALGQRARQHRSLPDLRLFGWPHHRRHRQRRPVPEIRGSRRPARAGDGPALCDQSAARAEPRPAGAAAGRDGGHAQPRRMDRDAGSSWRALRADQRCRRSLRQRAGERRAAWRSNCRIRRRARSRWCAAR